MDIRGVLFDFSGTLFRLRRSSWLNGIVEDGQRGPVSAAELTRRLSAPSVLAEYLPAEREDDWARRDLDPEVHRDLHVDVYRRCGLRGARRAERLYDRLISPAHWEPYPDTRPALGVLAASGVPVAVVSNIAWDIRATFGRHGLAGLVAGWALSYEEGWIKPDPPLFEIACTRIGVSPENALMIGDNREADGGAAAIGCRVAIVEPSCPKDRPDALLAALTGHGVISTGRSRAR